MSDDAPLGVLIINEKLTALVDAVDAERAKLNLTDGDILVFGAVVVAGILKKADPTALTLTLGFILRYLAIADDASAQQAQIAFAHLRDACGVTK